MTPTPEASEAARLLAQIKTPKRADASRRNGLKPVRPGHRPRGRPLATYGECPNCHRTISLLKAGGFREHNDTFGKWCKGDLP